MVLDDSLGGGCKLECWCGNSGWATVVVMVSSVRGLGMVLIVQLAKDLEDFWSVDGTEVIRK